MTKNDKKFDDEDRNFDYEWECYIDEIIKKKSNNPCELCGNPVGVPGARKCADCE